MVTGSARAIGGALTTQDRTQADLHRVEIGALLYEQCAPTIKKLGLELGGNAPFIVFDDAM